MKRIYEQAHRVFTWLGTAENEEQAQLGVHKMQGFSEEYLEAQSKNKLLRLATTTHIE
jgi:hypothetical protein